MAKSDEMLRIVYQDFWEQRNVLKSAPTLTLDENKQNSNDFDKKVAHKELTEIVSYLLGGTKIEQCDLDTLIDLVQKYYSTQPHWKKLLLDYLQYLLQLEIEANQKQQTEFLAKVRDQIQAEHPELLSDTDSE